MPHEIRVRRSSIPFGISVLLSLLVAAGCTASRTALNDAIVAGDTARARQLLEGGASPNGPGACGPGGWPVTPLVCAISGGRPEAVRLLVERGADVNNVTPDGHTPLMAAAKKDLDTVRFLLDKGADVDGRGSLGWTALTYAVSEGGTADVVKLLLERGADVEGKSDGGTSALEIAAFRKRADLAKILMARGADIDAAIANAESDAAKGSRYRDKELAAARLLKEWKEKFRACTIRHRPDAGMEASFGEASAKYRAMPVKPKLPEEARVFRVQAEHAVSQKRFRDAVELYGKALNVSPWWPEGHFNQALILGESDCPEEAVAAMERYLVLVPDAPDARAARDKVYQWKGMIP